MRITNRDVPNLVSRRTEFSTPKGTVFARNTADDRQYVVYSYGYHWPLAVYDREADTWYVNMDKYSVTTSRHLGLVRVGIAQTLNVRYPSKVEETDQLGIQKYINR